MKTLRKYRPMIGYDKLRKWLIKQGFSVAFAYLPGCEGNECNWYAYRPSSLPARECETNPGKTIQIVVHPWEFRMLKSVEVELRGEAGGRWYKILCYSVTHTDLINNLSQIEISLIAAWNALLPPI
jgi:hypothetical protein